ncbi:DUF3600 domain-containing protein [Paenibacillus sp. MMS20-IR301]|uniref:DUF3600 domain-containing protein n=1 Tax=Paenibacillus sp. MMS20-IR301 TaxID=2895946 RepID=UPI0028EC0BA6|nr:DUF3600 domain-containing protein [Paenibacillus sp. MMS20-IR301]WNS41120.1 DUF3600 domain-containing protein [Paenibacillus sp. MMS20-IR301]
MKLEQDLRKALKEEAGGWNAPPELKGRILERIVPGQGGTRMKKWLVAAVVAATLIIPTGAYAGYNYLADSLYGSPEHVAEFGGTQQDYDRLEAKLQEAKNSLSETEYNEMSAVLQGLAAYNLQIADNQGVLHPDKLSAADQIRYEELAAELESYNGKLDQADAHGAAAGTEDFAGFSDQLLAKAEQTFSGEELATVKQLIGEWTAYHAELAGRGGSVHSGRVPDAELARQAELLEQLNPYLKEMGYMMKLSDR